MQAAKVRKPFIVVPVIKHMLLPSVTLRGMTVAKRWPLPTPESTNALFSLGSRTYCNEHAVDGGYSQSTLLEELDGAYTKQGRAALNQKAYALTERLRGNEIAVFIAFQTAISALLEPHAKGETDLTPLPNAAYLVTPHAEQGVPLVSQIVTPKGELRDTMALQALRRRRGGVAFG